MNDEVVARLLACVEATRFSGVIRVDVEGDTAFERAFGLLDRAHQIPNLPTTRFLIASGTKTFTALTVLSLVASGALALDTTARSLLGADLPLIDDAVTVAQLLSHGSGIGDYLDESLDDDRNAYVMTVPVHRLDSVEAYLTVLDGHPQVAPPGERFAYNNGGYVVLALLAERATGRPFADLVAERVVVPAGLTATSFERSDSPPADLALGYLHDDGVQTNVLHLPVLGGGDGGLATTVADVHALWSAVLAGRVVSPATVAEMVMPRGATESGRNRYGYGLWLPAGSDRIEMEGQDAGISFRSAHSPSRQVTYTVACNWTYGAWPIAELLDELAGGAPPG